MNNQTQKRSVNFPTVTLKALDKLAVKEGTTASELVRRYVEEGLKIDGHKDNADFIARIVRQEVMSVYHLEDIKAVMDHDTDRLAKMLMKIGKVNGAMFFLLVKVLINLSSDGSREEFTQMLSDAVALGVDYMQKKDFQINSFLYDTDNLLREAGKLR